MIIGEHNRGSDINVNPCKEKKLSNMRAAGKDDNVTLSPIKPFTLEQTINFIREDELVEVTPNAIRLRNRYLDATVKAHLDHHGPKFYGNYGFLVAPFSYYKEAFREGRKKEEARI